MNPTKWSTLEEELLAVVLRGHLANPDLMLLCLKLENTLVAMYVCIIAYRRANLDFLTLVVVITHIPVEESAGCLNAVFGVDQLLL